MYYVGVDLGGTKTAVGILNDNWEIIVQRSCATKKNDGYEVIVKDMAEMIKDLIAENNIPVEQIRSIGIGCPGTPDVENGIVLYSNNIPMENAPIVFEMNKYFDKPVYIDNDANCAALAESIKGAAAGAKSSVMITLGTGIGSGVVINGEIYNGFNGAGAEIGHMVIKAGGELCTCGRRGCWEAYGSATALIRIAKKAFLENKETLLRDYSGNNIENIEAKTVFDAAKAGDTAAGKVLDEYRDNVAEGLLNVANIFQPEIIAIGGGISASGDYLLEPIRKRLSELRFGRGSKEPKIVAAAIGNDAGILGAAMLGKKL